MLLLQPADNFLKFHLIEGQNARDQKRVMGYKRAWPDYVLWIPYILSGSPNECCYAYRRAHLLGGGGRGLFEGLMERGKKDPAELVQNTVYS